MAKGLPGFYYLIISTVQNIVTERRYRGNKTPPLQKQQNLLITPYIYAQYLCSASVLLRCRKTQGKAVAAGPKLKPPVHPTSKKK